MSRHVVQEVEVIRESPVGAPSNADDYDLLASVPGEAPADNGPRWDLVAEVNLDGSPVRRW